jgi:hypothetical protein
MTKRNLQRAGVVLAAFLLLTLGIAVPANATVYYDCPSGVGCMWVNTNGGGNYLIIAESIAGDDVCHNFGTGPWNDVISSASADYGSGFGLMLYENAGCNFPVITKFYVRSSSFYNFTGIDGWFNDTASAYKVCKVSEWDC